MSKDSPDDKEKSMKLSLVLPVLALRWMHRTETRDVSAGSIRANHCPLPACFAVIENDQTSLSLGLALFPGWLSKKWPFSRANRAVKKSKAPRE